MDIEDARRLLLTGCVAVVLSAALCTTAVAQMPNCGSELPSAKVSTGVINVIAKRAWQPPGGEFTFVIETPASIPDDALYTVCFGWKYEGKEADPKAFKKSYPTRLIKFEPDKKRITIAATVPDLAPEPP